MPKKSRLSEKQMAAIMQILSDDETEDENSRDQKQENDSGSDQADTAELIVFRGSPQAFAQKFGLKPPEPNEEEREEATEEAEEEKPQKEPKARARSRYFGG